MCFKLGKKFVVALATFSGFAFSGVSNASDDRREGFMFSAGIGYQHIRSKFEGGYTEKNSGIATSFKIGGGINEQFMLYYARNASWFHWSEEVLVEGVSGFGASYYLRPDSDSPYLMAVVGLADISAPFEEDLEIEVDSGTGFILGLGKPIKKNVNIEAALMSTDIDFEYGGYEKATSLQFTINYMYY